MSCPPASSPPPTPADVPSPTSGLAENGGGPFLSVVVRTQGRRPQLLAETLASLSLQTDLGFEICLVRHRVADAATDAADAAIVDAVVEAAPSVARSRIRRLEAPPGRRGVPLNAGIDAARGRYLAFLDDDDLARPDWVQTFREGSAMAPGALLRTAALAQDIRRGTGSDHEVLGPPAPVRWGPFDLLDHLHENRTPICTVAWPGEAFGRYGARVDEETGALEDWDLLLQLAPCCGVYDIDRATSIYRWWVDDAGSKGQEGVAGWETARTRVRRRLADRSLTWPASQLDRLVRGADELAGFRRFADELTVELADRGRPAAPGSARVDVVRHEFERLHRDLAAALDERRTAAAEALQQLAARDAELVELRTSVPLLLATLRREVTARLRPAALAARVAGRGRR